MKATRRWAWLLVAAAIVLVGAGVWLHQTGAHADSTEAPGGLRTVLEVISLIKTEYVDEVDALALISAYVESGTINGMLRALNDPYTSYLEPQAYEQMQIDTHGKYGGVGILVGVKDGQIIVVAPFEGTPGHAAGLRSGDAILEIEGRRTDRMSVDEAVSLMRGEEGSPLSLVVQREGEEPAPVDIVRAIIQVPSVTKVSLLEEGVGYIRLQRFSERTHIELDEALDQLEREGAAGLILDLRDNPGGALTGAVLVAERFLPGGPIVHMVGKNGSKQTFYADPRANRVQLPMVALVNDFSASAAEIVSGALQDRGHAVLVGTTTFGKGLVQAVIPMRGGAGLILTSARYQTAGGRFIHETGIEPDVIVEMDQLVDTEALRDDPQFLRALDILMERVQGERRMAG